MPLSFPAIPDQPDIATFDQLVAHGWSRTAIFKLASSRGRTLFPRVYCSHRRNLDTRTWVTAARLWAGPESVLTSTWALALHGIQMPEPPELVVFLVPVAHRNKASGRARTMRTTRLPTFDPLETLPVAPLSRALADAGRIETRDPSKIEALTISVLQQRRLVEEALETELNSGRRNGTAAVRRGLTRYREGAWSLPESVLARLIARRRKGLRYLANPRLTTQDGEFIGIPDLFLPDYDIAIQVHSRQFHSGIDELGRSRWERTVENDSLYTLNGIAVLGVAPTSLTSDPDRFLRRLDSLVAVQRQRARMNLQIRPCG